MQKGKCPKCGGAEVYCSTSESSMGAGLRAGEGQLLLHIRMDEGWIGAFHFGYLTYYACHDCGYIEIYSQDREALDRMKGAANWLKVKV
jgi:predicted nucleic-acid-binding Zn-ribbon protein